MLHDCRQHFLQGKRLKHALMVVVNGQPEKEAERRQLVRRGRPAVAKQVAVRPVNRAPFKYFKYIVYATYLKSFFVHRYLLGYLRDNLLLFFKHIVARTTHRFNDNLIVFVVES